MFASQDGEGQMLQLQGLSPPDHAGYHMPEEPVGTFTIQKGCE